VRIETRTPLRVSGLVNVQRAEQFLERLGSDRLDQVVIEPRAAGTDAIFLAPVSRDSDQDRVGGRRRLTQAARDFVTVHPGQPNIQNDHLWSIRRGGFERARTVVSAEHLMAPNLQKHCHAFRGVPVVVHDQQTMTGGRRGIFVFVAHVLRLAQG